ncbi:sensor histidine kinase inhibitor, KipI family [Nocardioides exalbidus]|uniref:Sensor histidine kinase inhibitor, KipI family n=1 Tax=Nocardioides exalbidus TaxID=402596 RepID=A0A1H4XCC6_9ACTN|nr:sensor histidine kinase inhibitor, KipI family [Nocardioides exalbidus]
MAVVNLVPVGPRACLAEVEDAVAAASLATWARAQGVAAVEIVPAAATVLFDGVDVASLGGSLSSWSPSSDPVPGPLVRVPVTYAGPDLETVAAHWGCSADEVVRAHTSWEFRAVFSGFAPGFSYLSGLPAERSVPRLDSPRARVAPGSVALADTWCGIYPTASPGGWLVLGTTDVVLWDVDRPQPALLAPGTRVRFEAAG